ncbi:MAG: hypothetical protein J3K34DRAFT_180654 [Monoraphidium minutum]|nr:MAG: hypothetical protein J3K34DRAFT_180654 [Monoraphidium minutum]
MSHTLPDVPNCRLLWPLCRTHSPLTQLSRPCLAPPSSRHTMPLKPCKTNSHTPGLHYTGRARAPPGGRRPRAAHALAAARSKRRGRQGLKRQRQGAAAARAPARQGPHAAAPRAAPPQRSNWSWLPRHARRGRVARQPQCWFEARGWRHRGG